MLEEINPNAFRTKMPAEYAGVHDVFNVRDFRLWFFAPAPRGVGGDPATLTPATPALSPYPTWRSALR